MTEADWKLRSIFHININCRDLDRSVAFYEKLGFHVAMRGPDFDAVADDAYESMGVVGKAAHKGQCIMFIGDDLRQTRLDVMEWTDPVAEVRPPLEPHQVGVPRIALWTKNVANAYRDLSAQGLEFLTPPAGPFPDRGIGHMVCLRDPDGLIVELIEFLPTGKDFYADKE